MTETLEELTELDACPEFRRLVKGLEAGPKRDEFGVGGLWGSSQAYVLAAATRRVQGPWVVVLSTELEAEGFAADLEAFGIDALHFAARESAGVRGGASADADSVRARLQAAQLLSGPPERRPRVIVASLLSMLQPIPSPESMTEDYLGLQVGGKLHPEELLERLVAVGYTREPLAEAPGEVSLRGDILDLYPFAADLPIRVELFDDEVESLRTYDPQDQRSIDTLDRASVCIASDVGGVEDGKGAHPTSIVSPTAIYVRVEPLRIEDQAEGLRIRSSSHKRSLTELDGAMRRHPRLALQSLPGRNVDFDTRSVQAFSVGIKRAYEVLSEAAAKGARTRVLCRNEAEKHRFSAVLAESGEVSGLEIAIGSVGKGFRLPAIDLVLLNHRELAGVAGLRRQVRKHGHHKVRALQSFFELRPGDLVVHSLHGVSLFQGLELMPRGGGEEEHLHLVFADDVSLFVPASRIDLVQRYIGSGSKTPPLDKMGGTAFKKRKEKVERAIQDLAADLLEVQALRETHQRNPWPEDDELARDLVEAFPYTPTEDQATADLEIQKDLHSTKPLDRLLCGDVGFGKTEVALRAAFRVVNGGGQVALLVPTTVLADQHCRTFRERLADFPVRVESFSRNTTGKELKQLAAAVTEGEVDIAIGTHRLLSKDVRFKNLGLVIIDEEQRFGVRHKEHFKNMRATVDVLTLSATPIPRTLHMSLAGVRDISALSVPPEGRQDIETKIAYCEDDELIREAILREKRRGGQVFFLHNRVHSIEGVANRLQALLPECVFAVGHGQMPGRELKSVMDCFIEGDADVLVSTTIVENGIDIPSAGTIIIDRADMFGLAELHQLRGRVGRGAHKSFCYLLVEETRPLKKDARERLAALEEMCHLGAGFQISMKDLELRGAGNILGPEQSGHIAAIGYDMYCRLLKSTVDRLSAGGSTGPGSAPVLEPAAVELETGLSAYLPKDWIPSPKARLELLRHLDSIHTDQDAKAARAMLRDRYGRLPESAERLVSAFRLRALLANVGISRLSWREDMYLLEFNDRVALEGVLTGRAVELRPLKAGQALLVLPEDVRGAAAGMTWLEGLLRG